MALSTLNVMVNLPQAIDIILGYVASLSNLLSFCFAKTDVDNNLSDIETKRKR